MNYDTWIIVTPTIVINVYMYHRFRSQKVSHASRHFRNIPHFRSYALGWLCGVIRPKSSPIFTKIGMRYRVWHPQAASGQKQFPTLMRYTPSYSARRLIVAALILRRGGGARFRYES